MSHARNAQRKKEAAMTPRQAVKFTDIVRLQTDHKETVDGWIIVDGNTVTICKQRNGEPTECSITFSRRTFHALIDWYEREQKMRKP